MDNTEERGSSMPPLFEVKEGSEAERATVADCFVGLSEVSAEVQERTITAWVSSWRSSSYVALEEMPYSPSAPTYQLIRHVNEVVECGLRLTQYAEKQWNLAIDRETLIPTLLLHDVDKPLLYVMDDGRVAPSKSASLYPHGVLGAMLLHELGFPDVVVSTVATHSAESPRHGANVEAWVLHYADFFATDYVLRQTGNVPFYQLAHYASAD